tara:strand:- start:573 stop:722 length:150 start_codon:yes stop_codon:yes gene_type:complete
VVAIVLAKESFRRPFRLLEVLKEPSPTIDYLFVGVKKLRFWRPFDSFRN